MQKTYRGVENYSKPRQPNKNMPSFSSTLLDEIYRSIDENIEKTEVLKTQKEKRQSGFRLKSSIEDEEIASLGKACLVEKWVEEEISEKARVGRRQHPEFESKSSLQQENDLVFFSSSSSSSDSSGQLSSSSDTEFFGSTVEPKVSCFSMRLKPVRTREIKNRQRKDDSSFFDHPKNEVEDDLCKSTSRALKIYADLNKVKQPISPGMMLTSFINSILKGKKPKNLETNKKVFHVLKSPPKESFPTVSGSCLSKYSSRSRENLRNGVERTVRFHPVSVIVDEDSKACGHRSIYPKDSSVVDNSAWAELILSLREENRNLERVHSQRKDLSSEFRTMEYEPDDAISESSSDLFELDHLALFGGD